MTQLRLYADDSDPRRVEILRDFDAIVAACAQANIRLERWQAGRPLGADATQDEVLAAYAEPVAKLKRDCGFVTADVIGVNPATKNHPELRKKFLDEHIHTEDEARFFIEGAGLFCIHAAPRVFALECTQGDLINVPKGTRHWFDMGPAPHFRCIRLFSDPSGWVANFTGTDVAQRFPRYGEASAP